MKVVHQVAGLSVKESETSFSGSNTGSSPTPSSIKSYQSWIDDSRSHEKYKECDASRSSSFDISEDNSELEIPETIIEIVKDQKDPKKKKYTRPSINHRASAPAELQATLGHSSELEYLGVVYSLPRAVKEKHTVKVAAEDTVEATMEAAAEVSKERFQREPWMRNEVNTVYADPEMFCLVKLTMTEEESSDGSESSEGSETSDGSETSEGSATSEQPETSEGSVTSEGSGTSEGSTEDGLKTKGKGQKQRLIILSTERVATFICSAKKGRAKAMYVGEEYMVLGEDYHFDRILSNRANILLEEARDKEFWLERSSRRM